MTHHLSIASDDESPLQDYVEDVEYFPSIHSLFKRFNILYFEEKLSSVSVEWSSKMTLCAGLCYYHRKSGFCSIKLSGPILKFRPINDLKDTLLVRK